MSASGTETINLGPSPNVSASGTEMVDLGPGPAASSPNQSEALAADIDVIVESRVRALMEQSELRLAAQAEAWKGEMAQREELMTLANAELNAQLMEARRLLTNGSAASGSASNVPIPGAGATPQVKKKHKVDSRRQIPKIVVPGGRMGLRSGSNQANIRSSSVSGGPVIAMDTEADGSPDEAEDLMDVRNDGNTSQIPPPPEALATLAAHMPNINETPALNPSVPTSTDAHPPRVHAPAPIPPVPTSADARPTRIHNTGRETNADGKKKAKKAIVVKAAAEVFRYLPREMPEDLRGLPAAMILHLRILWGLLDAKEVPKNPPASLLAEFHQRFSDEGQLFASREIGPELIPRHLIQIGTLMSSVKGRQAERARNVEQNMLSYVQACLARFGLVCWCPDLRQSAYSLYNSACRIIAIDTFKQALVSHTYLALAPNTSYASNMIILVKLYDHFVYYYMRTRYRREGRVPGSVAAQLQASPQYQGRIRLAAARLKFLVENNYPQRYRALIDSKATSDDEFDPRQKAWVIKRRPERSDQANAWFRILDKKRHEVVSQNPNRKWRERKRIVPDTAVDSLFVATPDKMPIDYYKPDFFNELQPATRNRIAATQVSFLEKVEQSFTWCAEERITDKEFNRIYAPARHALYCMVSDEDCMDDADDEWAEDPPEDDDTNMEMSDSATVRDNLVTVESARESLSDHMSSSSASVSGASSFISASSESASAEAEE